MSRNRSAFLIMVSLSMSCEDGNSKDPAAASAAISEKVEQRLRECEALSEGKFNGGGLSLDRLGDQAGRYAECVIDCIDDATCTEITGVACNTSYSDRLFDCFDQCEELEIDCDDGEGTYELSELCDGDEDCEDGSDEREPRCEPDKTYCEDSGEEIPPQSWCDGEEQCDDGSDESDCEDSQQFKCETASPFPDLNTVPAERVCNGYPDCMDGSDEEAGCAKLMCDGVRD